MRLLTIPASDGERSTDPASSRVARIGLPKPAVAAELFSRSTDVEACTTPAVPPAPMMAIEYCSQGGRSVRSEALARMPATTASGAASVSSRLSKNGT